MHAWSDGPDDVPSCIAALGYSTTHRKANQSVQQPCGGGCGRLAQDLWLALTAAVGELSTSGIAELLDGGTTSLQKCRKLDLPASRPKTWHAVREKVGTAVNH